MTYVPTPVYVPPPQPPSRRARELAERLRAAIDDYRRHEPDTSSTDVRQALNLASPPRSASSRPAMVALGAALLLSALLLGFAVLVKRGIGFENVPVVAVAIGLMLILGLAVAIFVATRR